MEKITITEALSEINLIKKKTIKKQEIVTQNLARAKHMPDPYVNEGGSFEFNKRELQAIKDLNLRMTKIRGAISRANLENKITISGETRSINDWLTWKREISGQEHSLTLKAKRSKLSENPTGFCAWLRG